MSYRKKLQQLQIVTAYWTNQAIFVMNGHNEEEMLGIGFETRKATISKMEGEQKEYLELFLSGDCTYQENLRVICERLSEKLDELSPDKGDSERKGYEELYDAVRESWSRLHDILYTV